MERSVAKGPQHDFARFWAKVSIAAPYDCWEWVGGCDPDGYGIAHVDGAPMRAHRYAYQCCHGKLPVPMALHRCGNRACVNPAHLYEGDARLNQLDAIADGTHAHHAARAQGVTFRPNAKLKEDDVRDIKRRHALGENQRSIARRYGTDAGHINQIVRGKIWKGVQI